jgi:hypothetical protein
MKKMKKKKYIYIMSEEYNKIDWYIATDTKMLVFRRKKMIK